MGLNELMKFEIDNHYNYNRGHTVMFQYSCYINIWCEIWQNISIILQLLANINIMAVFFVLVEKNGRD